MRYTKKKLDCTTFGSRQRQRSVVDNVICYVRVFSDNVDVSNDIIAE